ncbi:MAG TPA: LacI family transcriptional regulator [Firmicutes bacterium]|nr:MAG: hypothetical protein AA931_05925 [Peptococcaceae bacterium 1109]HHT72153.1 LacI family transcriptional regulator [Bacillota bacterium]
MGATIKDVAKHAGVSTATVSRVLNGCPNVKEHLVKRVRSSIIALRYRPNSAARSLKTKKTNTIGILVPDISNPYFMQISKAIEDVLAPHGFSLIFASSDEESHKEARLLEVLSEYRADCLVVATAGGNDELLRELNDKGPPVVLVDRLPQALAEEMDYVVEDNYDASYRLALHFVTEGARTFGLIHGPLTATTAYQRAQGCHAALAEELIPRANIREFYGDFSKDAGREGVRQLLASDPPDAILALNNSMAWGAFAELTQNKFRIGEDILLGSYGVVETGPLHPCPLPYVDQNPRKMGERVGDVVCQRLVKRTPGPITYVMQQQLIIDI